jgi:hypothetical protein
VKPEQVDKGHGHRGPRYLVYGPPHSRYKCIPSNSTHFRLYMLLNSFLQYTHLNFPFCCRRRSVLRASEGLDLRDRGFMLLSWISSSCPVDRISRSSGMAECNISIRAGWYRTRTFGKLCNSLMCSTICHTRYCVAW